MMASLPSKSEHETCSEGPHSPHIIYTFFVKPKAEGFIRPLQQVLDVSADAIRKDQCEQPKSADKRDVLLH